MAAVHVKQVVVLYRKDCMGIGLGELNLAGLKWVEVLLS